VAGGAFCTLGLSGLGVVRELGSDVGLVHLNFGWGPEQREHLWRYLQFGMVQNAPGELKV